MITFTKSGSKVEILAVLGPGEEADGKSIVGVLHLDDMRSVETWSRHGGYRADGKRSPLDLSAIPLTQSIKQPQQDVAQMESVA